MQYGRLTISYKIDHLVESCGDIVSPSDCIGETLISFVVLDSHRRLHCPADTLSASGLLQIVIAQCALFVGI
jgi:hypothetical protein